MKRRTTKAKELFSELSRRERGQVLSRMSFLRSQARTRLESFVPSRLRWILPYIGESLPPELMERFRLNQEEENKSVEPVLETTAPESLAGPAPVYRQYLCQQREPLSCQFAQQAVQSDPTLKYCPECGFPAPLAEKAEIQGSRGRYRVTRSLNRRGMGRLYEGMQVPDGQPIVIKEYVLPSRTFSREEARQRGEAFVRLAGVSLADGSMRDFRVISPWEAIADQSTDSVPERCYLISQGTLDSRPTLRTYLAQGGAMGDRQVYQVLNQVLQTLECLHSQKFRLRSGQIHQGVAHGNINLDSLLISGRSLTGRMPGQSNGRSGAGAAVPLGATGHQTADTEFFIHTCDLALWERLFDLPTVPPAQISQAQDLVDLGYVGFYLLAGQWRDRQSGQPLDPTNEDHWAIADPALKGFLRRLMGIDRPFDSATVARQELQVLRQSILTTTVHHVAPEPEEEVKPARLPWWLYSGAALVLLGALVWWFVPRSQPAFSARRELLLCCMDQVSGVPDGNFTYTGVINSTWGYVLQQENLIAQNRTLEQELTRRQPKLRLYFKPEATGEAALEQVRAEQADFAVTSLTADLSNDLAQDTVAYDGLTVFVAFSYARRRQGLPTALNGQITLAQLRQLYTGEITNWRQLGGPDLPVKLYIPTDPEAIALFKQRVLQSRDAIALFEGLVQQSDSIQRLIRSDEGGITPLETFSTLRQVIREFEQPNPVGAIAFGTLSKVFGQCSVYPLAIAANDQPPVQPLVQSNGQAVNPNTDLCNAKGNYHPDINLFATGRYPLGYPVAVVYPRDNSRPPAGATFANLLRTEEGQRLLAKTGLVPLTRLEHQ